MPIAGVTTTTGPTVGAAERDYSQVSKVDFMQLLVAQIQNQDPLSPMDNQQFTSQITQFTMLEEMEQTNAKLEENLLVGQAINNTTMLGLVGKQVTVEGNKLEVTGGMATENMIAVDAPATATVEVLDRSGRVVATYQKPLSSGLNDVTWNGKLDDDTVAEDGDYSLRVSVENSAGAELEFATLMTGAVDGLRYEGNQAVVIVGGLEYYVSEIYKVS